MPRKKQAKVQEASASPPPLPQESPAASPGVETTQLDVPIATLGDDSDEGSAKNEDQDSSKGSTPEAVVKDKGKAKAVSEADGDEETGDKPHSWQAVWSAEKNGSSSPVRCLPTAWYFWNTISGEVTWTNPLPQPDAEAPPLPSGPAPTSSTQAQAPLPAQRRFGVVPDIDPALAFLLPPEARGGPSDPTAQSAMFNARTGRFTANDYMYNVEHLDEYNRMKRMTNQYFDQDAWERDMAEHNAKRKRDAEAGIVKQHSKKDMERFKKQRQEKRLRGQAWLRD